MSLDPRIQGHSRELLEACREALLTNPGLLFDRAAEVFHYTDNEKNTLGRAYATWYYAIALNRKGEDSEAEHLLEEVKEYAQRTGENILLVKTYRILGHCCQSRDEKLAEKMYLEGVRLCREGDVHIERYLILESLSQCYQRQGRIGEALTTIYHLKHDIESSGQNILTDQDISYIRIRMLYILGIMLGILGDPSSALMNFDQAMVIAREGRFTREIIELNRVMGIGYINLHRYDEAEKCLRELLDTYSSNIIPQEKGNILRVLGNCLLNINRFTEAEQVLNEAMHLTKGSDALLRIQRELSTIKLLKNDVEGLRMLKEIQEQDRAAGRSSNLSETDDFRKISEFYKRTGDYGQALEYQELYVTAIEKDRDKRQLAFAKVHEQKAAEDMEHEKLVLEKDKEILRLELERKQAELSMQATQLVTQTELLARFRDELREIVRKAGTTDSADALKQVKEKLKELPCKQIDWEKFETEFKAVHPEFMHKLYERYPALTPMEVKMCSLLRLALKSQEIARLFCVTERAVEFHRLNIRKKCEIPKEQSLSAFLNNL